MDQLIQCSKCFVIPYDILMMNCSHNLCIKCAVERIRSQHTVKSLVGRHFLQCEKCKGRTNLDQQSIGELQKVEKNKSFVQKVHVQKDGEKRLQTPINSGRHNQDKIQQKDPKNQTKRHNSINARTTGYPKSVKQNQKIQKISKSALNNTIENKIGNNVQNSQQPPIIPITNQTHEKKQQLSSKSHVKQLPQSNYGECQTHIEQPVMYYCFNCKIHCFCAQCVLIGKHNQHDVKIIKKAYPIIEKNFQDAISQTKKQIETLLQSNKLVANDINASKNKTDSIKKIIQKAFDEVRSLIREKQLQYMKIIDQQFIKLMQTNNGAIKKKIQSRLKQQQQLLVKLEQGIKKEQKCVINMYADEWSKIQILLKNQQIKLPTAQTKFNDSLNVYIAALLKQIKKIQIKKLEN